MANPFSDSPANDGAPMRAGMESSGIPYVTANDGLSMVTPGATVMSPVDAERANPPSPPRPSTAFAFAVKPSPVGGVSCAWVDTVRNMLASGHGGSVPVHRSDRPISRFCRVRVPETRHDGISASRFQFHDPFFCPTDPLKSDGVS